MKQTEAGTWYIDVTDRGAGGETKSVKNASSRRRVPLHPELIKIGFLDYLAARKKQDQKDRVFGDLKANKYGDPAAYLLRRFNERYVPDGMHVRDNQSFHSFRHTFRDAIRRLNAPADVLRTAGWTVARSASDNYGSEQDNPDLTGPYLAKLGFPGLDLSSLHGRGGDL